jgi:hypothetical protein
MMKLQIKYLREIRITVNTMEDPFNWPMPKRADLMSLSTLGRRDVARVKTANYVRREREQSCNLETLDIQGRCLAFSNFEIRKN